MALPDMRRRISFLSLLLVISPLSGCAIVERWQPWQAWQAPLPPTPNLLPQERLQLAIDLLDRGKSRRANVELKAYRADLTNDNGLPGKPSPNGSAVANGNAAGNSNAAATGNAVANSNAAGNSNVVANSKPAPPPPQILPRMKPDDPPSPAPKQPLETSADPWAAIREDVEAGRYDAAIRVAESNHVTPDRAQAGLLASAYAASAKAVRRSNATQSGTQALLAGELYLEAADMPEEALDALQLAVAVSPNDVRARTLLASAKSKTVEIHYRNGLIAFRRQDLDGAIAAWDRVLAIDPNHEKAQANKAQALVLKRALQTLM